MLDTLKTEETGADLPPGSLTEQYLNIACEQAPAVSQILKQYDGLPLKAYLTDLIPKRVRFLQPQSDLAEAVFDYAEPLLGASTAKKASDDLLKSPTVLTANHHGVDYFSQSVQGSLLFALSKQLSDDSITTVPIFSCGNIPLDNLTYPLGLLLYHVSDEGLSGIPKKLPLFSNKYRREMVSVSGPFDRAMVQRAISRIDKMTDDREISSTLTGPLHDIFENDYCSPYVMDLKSYSEQSVVLNNRIFKRLFENSEKAPDIIYLELEKLVHLLLKKDLDDPDSLANRVLFHQPLRKSVFETLNQSKVCWDMDKLIKRLNADLKDPEVKKSVKGCGTLFFWGINNAGRRVPLYLENGHADQETLKGLDDRGELYELSYTPQTIADALKENRLLPSLFTSFMVLSFARGVSCVGGYYQCEYLPEIQKKLVHALREYPEYHSFAERVEEVETRTYLSGMQTVMSKIENNALVPSGPVEILAGGGLSDNDIEQILSLDVRDAHLASLIETIPDVAPWTLHGSDWKKHLAQETFRILSDKIVVK